MIKSDGLIVIRSMPYTDLHGAVTLPRPASLQLNMRNGSRIILHATKASAIQNMVQTFCHEFRQVSYRFIFIYLSTFRLISLFVNSYCMQIFIVCNKDVRLM